MEKERSKSVVANPLRAQRCENCACWAAPIGLQSLGSDDPGSCHANYPICVPVPTRTGAMGAMSLFPPMHAAQWCDKWKPVTN